MKQTFVINSFQATEHSLLSVVTNELVEVIEDDPHTTGWVIAQNQHGQIGLVPGNNLYHRPRDSPAHQLTPTSGSRRFWRREPSVEQHVLLNLANATASSKSNSALVPSQPSPPPNAQTETEDPNVAIHRPVASFRTSTCVLCQELGHTRFLACCRACVCVKCLEDWVDCQLKEGTLVPCCCNPDSPHYWDPVDLKSFVTPEKWMTYEEELLKNLLRRSPDFVWCPNKKCGGGVFVSDGLCCSWLQCPHCDLQFCFRCGAPYHTGKTCEQYWNEDAKLQQRLQKSRLCNTCLLRVQTEEDTTAGTPTTFSCWNCRHICHWEQLGQHFPYQIHDLTKYSNNFFDQNHSLFSPATRKATVFHPTHGEGEDDYHSLIANPSSSAHPPRLQQRPLDNGQGSESEAQPTDSSTTQGVATEDNENSATDKSAAEVHSDSSSSCATATTPPPHMKAAGGDRWSALYTVSPVLPIATELDSSQPISTSTCTLHCYIGATSSDADGAINSIISSTDYIVHSNSVDSSQQSETRSPATKGSDSGMFSLLQPGSSESEGECNKDGKQATCSPSSTSLSPVNRLEDAVGGEGGGVVPPLPAAIRQKTRQHQYEHNCKGNSAKFISHYANVVVCKMTALNKVDTWGHFDVSEEAFAPFKQFGRAGVIVRSGIYGVTAEVIGVFRGLLWLCHLGRIIGRSKHGHGRHNKSNSNGGSNSTKKNSLFGFQKSSAQNENDSSSHPANSKSGNKLKPRKLSDMVWTHLGQHTRCGKHTMVFSYQGCRSAEDLMVATKLMVVNLMDCPETTNLLAAH